MQYFSGTKIIIIFLITYSSFVYAKVIFLDGNAALPKTEVEDIEFNFPKKVVLKNDKLDLTPILNELKRIGTESKFFADTSFLFSLSFIWEVQLSVICRLNNTKPTSKNNCKKQALSDFEAVITDIKKAQAKKILFPPRYRPIWKKNSKEYPYFNQAKQALDKSETCDAKCRAFSISQTIMWGNSAQFQQLSDKIKNKDKTCQKNIVDTLTDTLEKAHFPKKCEESSNKSHPVCQDMLKSLPVLKNRVLKLTNIAYGSDATQAQFANALCRPDGTLKESFNHPEKILDFIRIIQNQCWGSMADGSQKMILTGADNKNQKYLLKKDKDGNYAITFPMIYVKGEGYDGPPDVDGHYRKKVQNCLKEASRYMKGPNGEKLKISISKPKPSSINNDNSCDNKGQKVHRIKIASQTHRSYVDTYSSDIGCPAITHEILHLTGLCDEYKERGGGTFLDAKTYKPLSASVVLNSIKKHGFVSTEDIRVRNKFPCRVVTVKNNIMSNSNVVWDNLKKAVAQGNKEVSLLSPGQFSSIIYGSCPRNKNFNTCSKLANVMKETKSCVEKKKQCEKSNAMGISKQQLRQDLEQEVKKLESDLKLERKPYDVEYIKDHFDYGFHTLLAHKYPDNKAKLKALKEKLENFTHIYPDDKGKLQDLNARIKNLENIISTR